MTVSELIRRLQELQKVYGPNESVYNAELGTPVKNVYYNEDDEHISVL